MLLIGKPSISMGHLYHGYVKNNHRIIQLASFWTQLLIFSENIGKGPKSWSTRWKSSPVSTLGIHWHGRVLRQLLRLLAVSCGIFPPTKSMPANTLASLFLSTRKLNPTTKIKIWSNSTRLGWWETSEQRSFKRQGGPIFLRSGVPRMCPNMGVEAAQRPMWDDQNGSTS